MVRYSSSTRPDYRRSVLFGGARRRVSRRRVLLSTVGVFMAASALLAGPGDQPAPASPAFERPTATSHAAPDPAADDGQDDPAGTTPGPAIDWRRSRAIGEPYGGRLRNGVQFPAEGPTWFTWDPVLRRSPDRPWRRYGTDALVRTILRVLREYRAAHPDAPRVGIGDLSRPQGGPFGRVYGGLGHASHQNGLDVDVYYPRKDGLEKEPLRPSQVDMALSQDLVSRFVAAGALKVYVGPNLPRFRGPRSVVERLVHHDDHLHVRIGPPPR
jgi:murein endopeptidase